MNPTSLFTGKSDDYRTARPRYPQVVMQFLQEELKLAPGSQAADIGAGTCERTEVLEKVDALFQRYAITTEIRLPYLTEVT